jgi:succinate dehydrogenase/fumarate reductase flavoprotein subunit
VKQKVDATLVARNSWEVIRCLETLNLLDLGELVFLAAMERKETRGLHQRPDYPITNPMLDGKAIFVKQVNGNPVMEWKKIE